MPDTIILIGPICAGKSTLAKSISKKLGIPQCAMDDIRFDYYKEAGFSEQKQKELKEKEGFEVLISRLLKQVLVLK